MPLLDRSVRGHVSPFAGRRGNQQCQQGHGGLLKALCHTYQPPPDCRHVASAFRKGLCPDSGNHYLFLEMDCQQLLANIYPDDMAMLSGDVVESHNRLLKKGFNAHANQGAQGKTGCRSLLTARESFCVGRGRGSFCTSTGDLI